jgi:hypothetical protein
VFSVKGVAASARVLFCAVVFAVWAAGSGLAGCARAPAPPPAAAAAPPGPGAGSTPAAAPVGSPHPRLLLSPEIGRRLKAKAAAADPDWERLRAEADRFSELGVAPYDRNALPRDGIAYAYQGLGWLEAITSLGLAYQATGEPRYARKVAEILREANATVTAGNLEPIAADRGFPSRSAALGVALGFDWVYPALAAEERAATVRTLNRWFDWYLREAFDAGDSAVSNYFGGHLLGFGAAGYATLGDNPRAGEIISHARDRFAAVAAPAFAPPGPFSGGFPVEGYVYGTNHFQRLLQYLLIAGAAEGGPSPAAIEYAERIARNLLHAVKPNRWQAPDEAEYPGDNTGILHPGLPLLLTEVLAGRRIGTEVQHLVRSLGRPPDDVPIEGATVERLLYWDPARPAADCAGSEPPYLHSPGDEHLFMRSSWSPEAVWASFNAGMTLFSSHQVRASGHLAVQRGNDALLVYAGQWKGKSGLAGQPQQFQTTSAFANTLFVDDGGAYLYAAERYLGGQGGFAETRPFPFVQTADLTWAKLDASATYDRKGGAADPAARSLRRFVRTFVYLRPATFVVFDRVALSKPSFRKEVRFHFGGTEPPTIAGNLATSVAGGSALHVRTVLPRSPALAVGWNTARDERLGPYLAVSAKVPSTELDVLNVLSAVARRAPAPPATLVTADRGVMVGVHVAPAAPAAAGGGGAAAAGDLERVVLFSAAPDGPVAAPAVVRYRVRPRGPGRHHLFDLPPGRSFGVRAAPAPGGPGAVEITVASDAPGAAVRSSDAGAVAFDLRQGRVTVVP